MVEHAQWEEDQPRQPFCSECGTQTIGACESCKSPIPNGRRPSYCGQCGKPFPWTATALQAAKEFTDELDLSSEEKTSLKATLDELTVDSPRTELAVHRFKKFLIKIGPAAGEVLKKISIDVATEAAKKIMRLH